MSTRGKNHIYYCSCGVEYTNLGFDALTYIRSVHVGEKGHEELTYEEWKMRPLVSAVLVEQGRLF